MRQTYDPGQLDRRITIQKRIETREPDGQSHETWQDVVTVWAAKETKSGSEKFVAERVVEEEIAFYKIRWRAGIEATQHRIKEQDGALWRIEMVKEIGRRHMLEFRASRLRGRDD